MQKIYLIIFVLTTGLLVSCGPSAAEKEAAEKAKNDSITRAEQARLDSIFAEEQKASDSLQTAADTVK